MTDDTIIDLEERKEKRRQTVREAQAAVDPEVAAMLNQMNTDDIERGQCERHADLFEEQIEAIYRENLTHEISRFDMLRGAVYFIHGLASRIELDGRPKDQEDFAESRAAKRLKNWFAEIEDCSDQYED